ncbi:MAG: hypothetical protein L3J06_02715 [Cyclobacteriaceae bacterium]|nr:hypothetical protein [Cyclobacteriaceae bacterium]
MKTKNTVHLIILLIFCLSCKALQNNFTSNLSIPRIDNYTKGELEIKVTPFGLDGEKITVGQIQRDGRINFNWQNIDLNSIEDYEFYLSSIKNAIGMTFCNEKEIEESINKTKAVEVELSLYKKNKYVGIPYPATQKEVLDNASINRHTSLVLGSYLSWYYSDGDANFKATCKVNLDSENNYNFKEVTNYNILLKEGWNIVKHTLVEKEDWKNESNQGSLPKLITKTSITTIPNNIN